MSKLPPSRVVQLACLIAGYLLAIYVFFRPVQLRLWNELGAVDVLTMAGLILPFMVVRWLVRPRYRVTRYAWGASAVMALDLVCFAMAGALAGSLPLVILYAFFVEHYVSAMTGAVKE